VSRAVVAAKGRGELSVLVACHTFLVALPARSVVRLFLPGEVTERVTETGDALLGTVRAADRLCAAWDLGRMLELDPLTSAWVVLDVERGGRRVSIALRTGVCALVVEVRPEAALPTRTFKARAQAFPAAFAASPYGPHDMALFGLWMDPARLFTDDELARSLDAVVRAREESAGA